MMEPAEYGDNELMMADEEDEHTQLPDVEEYKAIVGHRSPSNGFSVGSKVINSLGSFSRSSRDPDGKGLDPPEEMDAEQQDSFVLPQAEDHYANHEDVIEHKGEGNTSCGRCFWKSCALVSLTLLIAIILLVVWLTTKGDESLDALHWVHGDTASYFAVRDYVMNVAEISSSSVFDSTSSPQYLAAQWMAHGDARRMGVPATSDLEFNERYVLAVFYFSMEGQSWTHQYNFLGGDHVCTWYQEFEMQDGTSVLYGVHDCKKDADDELYPQSIYMPNNGLQGFIPDEIRALKRLEYFNLEFNRGVVGTIPESFGDMNALTHLALQWCNLDGTIPYWLSQMSNIEYLGLGNNLLDGTVPSEIGLMQRLELLGLDDNDLYGDINIFRSLSNIKSLYLENNYFSGNLTDTLMQSWPNLEELDLSDCVFTGEVPPTMFNHQANLKVVDLHGNGFVGPLPDAINENFQLEFLAFHENHFTGMVPESFANFRVLRHLDLSQNLLSYTLPEKLSEMTTLEYLFTGTNNFAPGEVPKFLIELTNLRELSMKKNQLQGSIPQFMQYLSNLRFLDFHSNELTNEIPSGFGQLTDLRHLILKQNLLTGQIPSAFGSMTSLQVLLMEQNQFQGNAAPICAATLFKVGTFVADCGKESGNSTAGNSTAGDGFPAGDLASGKITCSCCSMCCDAGDVECNNWDWKGNLDPIWEYGYRRRRYSYDLGPVIWNP